MRLRTWLIGWAALIFGSSAAAGAYLLAQPSKEAAVETVAIVVAAADTPRGATLTAEMLELRPWPRDYLPADALRSLEEAEGRAVWIPLVKDEPVTDPKLTARGAGRGMAAMIPRGMRAVTLQTPNVSTAMAGFILPGNKVDVLLTVGQGGAGSVGGGESSMALLQNVEVLAVDQRIDASENVVDPRGMQSVTLLVTPAEAARLDLGQNRGTLRLALRNPEDSETSDVKPAMLSALQIGPPQPPSPQLPRLEPSAEPPERQDGDGDEAVAQTPAASVLLPVRTLRGTNSGVLYLRRPIGERDSVVRQENPTTTPPTDDAAAPFRSI